MLDPKQYKELVRINHFKAGLGLALDWLFIFGIFAICIVWPHPLVLAVSFVLMARTQLALSILMHEAAHQSLFKNAKLSDYICQFFIAGPIFFSMYSYKRNHLAHHRIPLQPDDPDITLTGGYPIASASLWRKLGRDLMGISYFKFIRYFLYGAHKRSLKVRNKEMPAKAEAAQAAKREQIATPVIIFSIILANAIIFCSLLLLEKAWLYPLLWLLPTMTILQVFLRLRGIAEHAGYPAGKDQMALSRTVINPLQTFFIAPHNVNYHIEHHAYPKIPYYNLPKVHRLLLADGSLPRQNLYSSYVPVLKTLVK